MQPRPAAEGSDPATAQVQAAIKQALQAGPVSYYSEAGQQLRAHFAKLPPRPLRAASKEETAAFMAKLAAEKSHRQAPEELPAEQASGRRISGRSLAADDLDGQRRSRRALGAADRATASPAAAVEPSELEVQQPAAQRREQPTPGRVSRRGVIGT